MKRSLVILTVIIASTVLAVGIVTAATEHNITGVLGGVDGDYFNVDGTMMFDSIKVGRQGEGGVTFFNGTIVNNTTTSAGGGIPVTFGDDVRIDGRVWRGASAGTSDSMPFIVNDNMEVAGTLTVGGFSGAGTIATADFADGAVTTAKLADDAVTTASIADGAVTQTAESSNITNNSTTTSGLNYNTLHSISMTTNGGDVFCMFSGYGTTDAVDQDVNIILTVDGEHVDRTLREATNGGGNGFINMSTSAVLSLAAGDHTIALNWNTTTGATATMHVDTLDCIELKK